MSVDVNNGRHAGVAWSCRRDVCGLDVWMLNEVHSSHDIDDVQTTVDGLSSSLNPGGVASAKAPLHHIPPSPISVELWSMRVTEMSAQISGDFLVIVASRVTSPR